jgi:hypothetical protein
VRRTWASNIHEKENGKFVRARIAFRKEFRCNPTKKQVEKKIKAADNLFVSTRKALRIELSRKPKKTEVEQKMGAIDYEFKTSVTVEDIMQAYDTGEEVSKPNRIIHACVSLISMTEGHCSVVYEVRRI